MFTLDTLVALISATVLNPISAVGLVAYLYFARGETFELSVPRPNNPYIPQLVTSPAIRKSLYFLGATLFLKWNSWTSRKALNNGVSDSYNWDKEIIVVTGGAGGIGGEVVRQLTAKHTRIAVLDLLPLTYPKPTNVEYFQCDLTDSEALAAAAQKIRTKWGPPTVLCAVAGIVRNKTLFGATKRDFDLTFGVNVIGLAMCYKEFVPDMAKKNHGHVVTVSSQTAYLAVAGMVDYAASKSAALALHEGLSTELKHVYNAPKVRCTVILPATVGTKMFKGLSSPSDFMFPVLKPEEVAAEIVGALWAGQARHIEMPFMGKLLTPLNKVLPVWWRIGMQDAAKDSMANFNGHKVIE